MTNVGVNKDKAVRVTENHGGYLGGECICCGELGWLQGKYGLRFGTKDAGSHLTHKKSCPMNKYADKERKRD